MTYGECRDRALQLINQYTLGGQKIAPSYNNQEDYILRIPSLINDAQMSIADTTKGIKTSVFLDRDTAEYAAHMYRFMLPEDLMSICGHGLLVITDGQAKHCSTYTRMGGDYLLVPDSIKGDIYLEYFRRPQMLPIRPADDHPLDNTADAQSAIPYFVAAMLALQDDAFAYNALLGMWNTKLSMLSEAPYAERETIEDVYDIGGMYDG